MGLSLTESENDCYDGGCRQRRPDNAIETRCCGAMEMRCCAHYGARMEKTKIPQLVVVRNREDRGVTAHYGGQEKENDVVCHGARRWCTMEFNGGVVF
ncbi:FAD-binding protein [Sesbania bispinosa]|nr:FAD-binding protein [Sesbania bispinosa]